ncbi:MAG: hypothetical protein GEEBNDBF_01293 [bacterium]|nr:hypothetical protein [bacterium]
MTLPLNRRQFLSGTAGLAAGLLTQQASTPAWSAPATDSCLVLCFLRGGMDGLHLLAPADDADYIAARPATLRVTARGEEAGVSLAHGLTSQDWRLHPAAAPLKELYDSGDLAFVHASGLRNGSRSHFEAQDLMEQGAAEGRDGKQKVGWLTRYVQQAELTTELPVVCLGSAPPKSLLGYADAVAMQSVETFGLTGNRQLLNRMPDLLADLYAGSDPVARAGAQTLTSVASVQSRISPAPTPGNQNRGQLTLGDRLASVQRLRDEGFGVRVATVDVGGWDTHFNQATRLSGLFEGMSQALHSWWTGLSAATRQATTLVVLSEFGRRVKANQSAGTDHGHANVMLVLGGGIRGGRMFGSWPGLAVEQLDNQVDLAITTDYREVLGEVLTGRLGCRDLPQVFPGVGGERLGLI